MASRFLTILTGRNPAEDPAGARARAIDHQRKRRSRNSRAVVEQTGILKREPEDSANE